jgi:D-alanyl-D-alanine carboxypeptidase (penicillin-binding protein 5/6)
MTGLLVLENADLDEVVTVSEEAAQTGGQEIGLAAGEQFTVGALFRALMVRSANDAASALAEHVAGSIPAFVDMMNSRAQELGLENTSFSNPHGMDAPGHYSSARDLLTLARLAMENPVFREVVRARAMVLPDDPEGNARVGISTNLMLTSYEGMMGVKTGLTPQALFTFVGAAERDGRRLYTVVLGSPENFGHFADARALLDYGFEDLGFYGDAVTKAEYQASMARVEPDHLVTAGQIETYLHLAGQGLMLEQPAPMVELPQPEPAPIVEVSREPQGAATSIGDALLFWVQRAIGG